MGFLDFLKDVSKGITSAVGSAIPIVGPAAASQLNKLYKKGGMVGMRKGGMLPMAKGGLAGIYENLPSATQELKGYAQQYIPQARQFLGLKKGGAVVSTPMGKMMVPMGKPAKKKRVQKKKK